MKILKFSLILSLIIFASTSILSAHHGKDFVVTETTELPEIGSYWIFLSTDFGAAERFNDTHTQFELTPGLMYGFSDVLAFEFHPHIAKEENEDLAYEATGFQLRYSPSFTVASGFQTGFSAEFEKSHIAGHDDLIDLNLVLMKQNRNFKIALNGGIQIEDEINFISRVGIAKSINNSNSISIELLSKFGKENAIDIIPSWTFETDEELTFRLGLGLSANDDRPSLSARSTFVFTF